MKKIILLGVFFCINYVGTSQTLLKYYEEGEKKFKLQNYECATLDYNKTLELNLKNVEAVIC